MEGELTAPGPRAGDATPWHQTTEGGPAQHPCPGFGPVARQTRIVLQMLRRSHVTCAMWMEQYPWRQSPPRYHNAACIIASVTPLSLIQGGPAQHPCPGFGPVARQTRIVLQMLRRSHVTLCRCIRNSCWSKPVAARCGWSSIPGDSRLHAITTPHASSANKDCPANASTIACDTVPLYPYDAIAARNGRDMPVLLLLSVPQANRISATAAGLNQWLRDVDGAVSGH
jgi:hypothetical protein